MTTTDTTATFKEWLQQYPPYREKREAIDGSLVRIIGELLALEKLPTLSDDDRALIRASLDRWHELCVEITSVP